MDLIVILLALLLAIATIVYELYFIYALIMKKTYLGKYTMGIKARQVYRGSLTK